MSRLLAAFAAAACLMPAVAQASPIVICNTGQAAGCVGTVADGAPDPNYSLIPPGFVPGPAKAIAMDGFPIPPWLANDGNSKWIGPIVFDGDSNGPALTTYIYGTTFSLAGLNPATASISGGWTSDNTGLDILLNGVSIPQGSYPAFAGFGALVPFLVPAGSPFLPGLNLLDFVVFNGMNSPTDFSPNPTGLRVDDIAGSADPVPEPASMVLLGSGLLALYRQRRRARH